ncbi:hypothetical protein ABID26_007120 [Mesorhizobium shonense]|uniref:Uncharacterized protein n=1 Tax=Mesorhizobium shonense TaxID=1209948 RepID=A0ABV2I472_9HYPH|nr:hypothetical protein [Mesorhizobium sp.]TIS44787.1 MAG: hypothetical protein E5W96_34995 [Mesorhizobium sp.]
MEASTSETLIKGFPKDGPEPSFSAWDAVRSAFVSEDAIDDDFAKLMYEVEAERKRDFGYIAT